jgi:DNA-binding CsgD family transcriptional regulator
VHVTTLLRATSGKPFESRRYDLLMRPQGLEHELRGSAVVDGQYWGNVTLHRERGSADFDDDEHAFIERVLVFFAEGIRVALLLESGLRDEGPDEPGLVLLDGAGEVEVVTPAAAAWLAELPYGGPPDELHPTVAALAAAVRYAPSPPAAGPARIRLRAASGRWIVIHASRLPAAADALPRVAVIIERAQPPELTPLIAAAYALSAREREVLRLVIAGAGAAEIASALQISPYTARDHLTSIFEKVGVHTRGVLVARVLADHYFPRLAQASKPGRDGWFA